MRFYHGPCSVCGNPLGFGNQFCSWECRSLSQIRRTVLVCEHCNEPFEVLPAVAGKRRFCGRSCSARGKTNPSGPANPLWREKPIVVCELCKSTFEVIPSVALNPKLGRFCSHKCATVWKNMHAPRTSSIEVTVAKVFDEMGVAYKRQQHVSGFVPDFMIGNTLIEVDGDYWHNLPKVVERDKLKNVAYAEAGYNLIRIWEHEVLAGDFSKLDALTA